jgi:hypothetical protein
MKLHKNAAVWFHLFKNQNPVSLSPLLVCAFFPSVRDNLNGNKDFNEAELLAIQKPSNFLLDSMEKKLKLFLIHNGFASRLHAKQLQVLRTTLILQIVLLFRLCMDFIFTLSFCSAHFLFFLINQKFLYGSGTIYCS